MSTRFWRSRLCLNRAIGDSVHPRTHRPPPFAPRPCSPAPPKLQPRRQATDMSGSTPKTFSSSIATRFLIISDTHSASPEHNAGDDDIAFRPPLPKADVLLHCGDLTMIGHLHEYEKTVSMLESIEADLKLVIAGNHDISLDETFYQRRGPFMHNRNGYDEDMPAKAREMWLGERAKLAGVTYLEEGTYAFTLKNGAKLRVYASPYQPEFCDWAFPYWRNQDRYNSSHQCTPNAVPIAENPVPDFPQVDVMMTHGPPMGILDATRTGEHVGCEHLLRAARRCKPRLHCFGHIHEAYGAQRVTWNLGEELDVKVEEHVERSKNVQIDMDAVVEARASKLDISKEGGDELRFGKETLMVNASIMTLTYKPWNGPWLVDMDLPKAD
ncbi:Metallo-dependent phosphatase [Ophiobolus disseminans]|uniref:Metallo-dependent phosphatase n=1 Tax=Ophiobolus disseminans TaxID=1469910 RepID=A0A6A7ABT0_9PLEO|nr:Metallo-dependent phosphatase [Ophiobolus disseminans]